jgi:hypothetical protein
MTEIKRQVIAMGGGGFSDGELAFTVSSRPHATVYKVGRVEEQVIEEAIETHYLGP